MGIDRKEKNYSRGNPRGQYNAIGGGIWKGLGLYKGLIYICGS